MSVSQAVEVDDDQEDEDAAVDSETKKTQSAIDITSQYLYDKLNVRNVADLVLVSMVRHLILFVFSCYMILYAI